MRQWFRTPPLIRSSSRLSETRSSEGEPTLQCLLQSSLSPIRDPDIELGSEETSETFDDASEGEEIEEEDSSTEVEETIEDRRTQRASLMPENILPNPEGGRYVFRTRP